MEVKMSVKVETLLDACPELERAGDGAWEARGLEPTLLVVLGRSVVGLEKVEEIALTQGILVVKGAKETHYLPEDALVGVKVEGHGHAQPKKPGFV